MAQAAIAYRNAEKSTRFLEKIEDFWKDTKLRDISAGAIKQSSFDLYPEVEGATRNRQVIVPTQAIINHAAEMGWCSKISVKRFPEDTKIKVPATAEWVKAFAGQAEKDGLTHLAALTLFLFGTGARIGEAVALTWADIDLTKRKAGINQTKTGHEREAHLPAPVIAALANIPSNRNPEDLVFGYASRGSVYKVWHNVTERAGIEDMTPHCCRHGFATTLLRKGIDVKTVAKLGGWKDAGIVLKHYAHAMDDPTITEGLFDTNLAHGTTKETVTHSKQKEKKS
ncbi:tyrosine-type recombinase/integrase [Shimia sediminis]|uniref:tyrosine-type recombinase/integrase n=1 Tax=Shimia sediminis TaxID=2497945 RepID=UPI001F1BCCED|nr:site-specific integrase [Shimia sediminis]